MEDREDRGGGGQHRAAKRLRTEEQAGGEVPEDGEEAAGSGGTGSRRSGVKDGVEDGHSVPPSPVVHVRGLCDAVVEADLVEALDKFGNICYVMMMPFKRQALVEFDSVESAERCVASGAREAVCVAERRVFFNFSTSQRINRPTGAEDPSGGNKVLLLSIQNPLYPITPSVSVSVSLSLSVSVSLCLSLSLSLSVFVSLSLSLSLSLSVCVSVSLSVSVSQDVLYTVFNPVVNVLRIVVFKRSGVQAMVEFESAEDAQKAKLALNGADIYADCCTLKIEYARPNRLNVVRNDSNSWDYTKHLQPERRQKRHRQAILGQHPSNCYGPHCPLLSPPAISGYRRSSEEVRDIVSYRLLLPKTSSSSGSVAMVSGLHPTKMNCSRVFNLLCLYGNVDKVKFMRSVPGSALVQMGEEFAVERVVTHLNGVSVFGNKLNVCVSRQQQVIPRQVFQLADGSSSFQDFSLTRNNRFNQSQSSRNIIQPPTAVLHFYNAPPTLSQHQLHQLCTQHDVPAFARFKVFDAKPGSKSLSGLLEFDSKTEAVEALIVLNHHQLRPENSCSLFTLKLCFSTSSHL